MTTYNSAFIVLSGPLGGAGTYGVTSVESFESFVPDPGSSLTIGTTTIDGSAVTSMSYIYTGPGASIYQVPGYFTMNDGEVIDYSDNDELNTIGFYQYFQLADV